MILEAVKLGKSAPKDMKQNFMPFQNERDALGRIIKPRTLAKSSVNVLDLFEVKIHRLRI